MEMDNKDKAPKELKIEVDIEEISSQPTEVSNTKSKYKKDYERSKTPRIRPGIGFEYSVVDMDALVSAMEHIHHQVDEEAK